MMAPFCYAACKYVIIIPHNEILDKSTSKRGIGTVFVIGYIFLDELTNEPA